MRDTQNENVDKNIYFSFFITNISSKWENEEKHKQTEIAFIVIKCSNISARMEVFGTNHDKKIHV